MATGRPWCDLGSKRDRRRGSRTGQFPLHREHHMDYVAEYFSKRTARIVGGPARRVEMQCADDRILPVDMHISETRIGEGGGQLALVAELSVVRH